MPSKPRKHIPTESVLQLRQRLDRLPPKSHERARQVASFAELYGVSTTTVYRAINDFLKPRLAHRSDHGKPRLMPKTELERYCELIAALKLRTTNKKGRHVSTRRAIELLENYGIETPHGLVKLPKGLLHKSTVDVYLNRFHLDHPHVTRESAAVRFQAEQSNECWQFDMSTSEAKYIDQPEWVDPGKGDPTMMLFSVVDDRSGVNYQEYHGAYGESAEIALRFLFNAMAPKADPDNPFQGRPKLIYMDCGPVSKSRVFQNVMTALGVEWKTHMPAGKDGNRTTARATGKVERPFRTVKELHETLYHFHKPQTERQANQWLQNYLRNYNQQQHRSEPHSRIEDWLANLPPEGFREMCTWEQFCRFAREPEQRKVGPDARVAIDGSVFEVDPDMAGEPVLLLWGLYDDELYVQYDGQRYGPYHPISGPIPLGRYRKFKAGKAGERADRIRSLADQIGLPIAALTGEGDLRVAPSKTATELPRQPFDADAHEYHFPTVIAAKLAIADELATPLAKVPAEDKEFIDQILTETLTRSVVLARVREYFRHKRGKQDAG